MNGVNQYYYGDPSHVWVPDHPTDAFLTWTSVDHRISHLPIFYRLRSGYGFANNSITAESTIGGAAVSTVYDKFAGVTAFSPSLRLARDSHHRDLDLNLLFDKQRSFFSLPHFVDVQTETASISKTYSRRFSAYVNYSITNTGDNWGSQQAVAYPAPTPPVSEVTGETFPGFTAFRGFATTRSLVEGAAFVLSPNVSGSVQVRENHDFPEPIPGPTSAPQIGLGGPQQIGVSPYQATLDLRVRLNANFLVDVTRSYSFGFGNTYLGQYTFLLSQ